MRSVQRSAGSQGYLPMPVLICPDQQAQETQTVELLVRLPYRGVCQVTGLPCPGEQHMWWVVCQGQQPGRG